MKRAWIGLLFFLIALAGTVPVPAQTGTGGSMIPGGHRGAVTALVRDEKGRILSAGDDGFLEIWNNQAAVDRFQLSPYAITSMAVRPGKPQICIVESDGLSLYRLSVWDYETKQNLFTLRFRDSISYINYSAAGSFLIVARSGRTGAAFIHSETGEVLKSPEELSGAIAFAATSRSERVMICYLSSGVLSYWDVEAGTEVQHFSVPANINNPLLFGNNCYLCGFDSRGLIVLDAVSGLIIARDESITRGSIFIDSPESSDPGGAAQFNYLASSGGTSTVFRMEVNRFGRLLTINRRTIVPSVANISAVASGDGSNVIIGTAQGRLWLFGSTARILETGSPERIIDVAASPASLAFITEEGLLGYIPLDYTLFNGDNSIALESASSPYGTGAYTNIIAGPLDISAASPDAGKSRFVLWQPGVSRSVPLVKTLSPASGAGVNQAVPVNSGGNPGADPSRLFLDKLPQRFPFRQAAILGKNLLVLDSAGMATIVDMESGKTGASYSAAGAVDAAFIKDDTIIVGRSAIAGNAPFLSVNVTTGETVALAYPGVIGIKVYRGSSGAIYGAVVNQSGGNVQTAIIRLNTSNPANSERLVEYSGEDSSFVLSESGGNLASTLGGSGATIYRGGRAAAGEASPEIIHMERTAGLPEKIIDGGRWFIVLDGEGGIAWHDNRTGKLLAVFRLYLDGKNGPAGQRLPGTDPSVPQQYPNLWVLEKTNMVTSEKDIFSGGTRKN